MAVAEEEDIQQAKELETLQRALKLNRRMLLGLLATAAVIVSVLLTSLVVINIQLSGRRDVPAEEFAMELEELRSHLQHLVEIHNSEALVYFDFQDRLDELQELYGQEQINQLRQTLVEREQDHQELLKLIGEGAGALAVMIPGPRDWTKPYQNQIDAARTLSEQRATAIKEAMAPLPELDAESAPRVER